MKIGIVSDTHSNENALKTVLEHMDNVGVNKKVHLGDIIGYGPRPSETLELTLSKFNYIVKGNHDYACEKEENSWGFNPQAKTAIDWTRKQLNKEEVEVLSNLAYSQGIDEIMFTHGSPYSPFDYITTQEDAKLGFSNSQFRVAFVGHTHVPFVWGETGFLRPRFTNTPMSNTCGAIGACEISVPSDIRAIINVGSVGQSRDGDNRATYAIYDTELNKVTIYKVPYAVDVVVGQMQRAGFDENACQRLIFGR